MKNWSFNDQARFVVTVQTPLRERGQLQIQTEFTKENNLLELVSRLQINPDLTALTEAELNLLNQLGLIAPAEQIPSRPLYAPELSFQWPKLYPYHKPNLLTPAQLEWTPLVAAPTHSQVSDYLSHTRQVWPEQLPFKPLLPICFSPQQWKTFESIREQSPHDLSPEEIRYLLATQLLSNPSQRQSERALWQRVNQSAKQQLSKGYLILRKVISPFQIAALRAYTRALKQEGYFELGTTQVALRDVLYNEPLMQHMHAYLNQIVSTLVGEALKPSYSIIALYHAYAELHKHTDRAQCRWNVSLVLDTEPEQNKTQAWPIYIEHLDKAHVIQLEMGDLVIYKGTDNPHWRPPLQAGRQVTVGLFHFVAQSFSGVLA